MSLELTTATTYLDYLRATLPPQWTTEAAHIRLIAAHLDRVERGEIDRLAIHLPPRHGKSETVTYRFPVRWLERNPEHNVLVTGYNEQFARKFGRRSRNIAIERGLVGSTKAAVDEWETNAGGLYMCRGVGSPPTGTGFNLVVIDDPIRRRADAESEIYRENVWAWYTDDLYTRLEPDGAIILIMTLWHHDDLGARAIASEPGRWTVLKLPAFAGANDPLGRRPGEALWPQRYSVADLTRTREVIRRKDGERSWEALYQQNPTPRSGSFFKTNKLEIVPAVPAGLRYVRAWDIAATENDGDYTVGVKMGSMACPGSSGFTGSDAHGTSNAPVGDGIVYITDVQRGQWATDERDRIIRQTAELDGPGVRQRFPQDPGAAGKSQAAAFIRLLAGFAVKTVPVGGDKATRADPFSSQVNAGNVKLLKAEWNHATIEELRQFPNGKHDDQVDAASDAYEELAALPAPHFVV